MPSATSGSEEPRYNELDMQRRQQQQRQNGSTCGQTDISSLFRSSNGMMTDDSDFITEIDPPRGFDSGPGSRPNTPVPDEIMDDDDDDRLASENRLPQNGHSTDHHQHQNGDHNNCNGNAQTSDSAGPTIGGPNGIVQQQQQQQQQQEQQQATPSTSGSNGEHMNAQHNHDNANNHQHDNKNYEASTSNGPSRFVNGINNIVTRISKAFANSSLAMLSTDRCLQDEPPKFAFGNKRTLEKTWKLMDKVVKCCQHPRMNLNNSPPFILEILPETYQHLKLIHTKYDSELINDNEYSQIFLRNLQNRCEQTLKLFKEAKDEMYDEESEHRHKLTRNTLVFNHILSELRAIFPNGLFIGDKYLITKKESAGDFWKSSFGSNIMVDWESFYHALQQVHSIDSSFFSLHALKQTIDLTCDDHISIFEFDVFTRLFQPWSTLLKNWQTLAVTHPGYKAFLTYDELKSRLQKHINKPGSYVFRLSCTRLGQWAIGYVTRDGQILQTIVQNISLSQALTETEFYIYPDGMDRDPELRERLCSGMTDDERTVTVTEEQYEIYCGVGNSFQTCKICFENNKDIRVEPCNHLLCTSCLLAWQESDGQGCPYCRTEIKETVQITMDLPKSNRRS